jgi:urease accessory protein
MHRDAKAKRKDLPILFTSLTDDPTAASVAAWVREMLVEHKR